MQTYTNFMLNQNKIIMKAIVFTLLIGAILVSFCIWYLVVHGEQLFDEKSAFESPVKDFATGSAVRKGKKFSRQTSKSPVIDVFEYIYTKFYTPKKL